MDCQTPLLQRASSGGTGTYSCLVLCLCFCLKKQCLHSVHCTLVRGFFDAFKQVVLEVSTVYLFHKFHLLIDPEIDFDRAIFWHNWRISKATNSWAFSSPNMFRSHQIRVNGDASWRHFTFNAINKVSKVSSDWSLISDRLHSPLTQNFTSVDFLRLEKIHSAQIYTVWAEFKMHRCVRPPLSRTIQLLLLRRHLEGWRLAGARERERESWWECLEVFNWGVALSSKPSSFCNWIIFTSKHKTDLMNTFSISMLWLI